MFVYWIWHSVGFVLVFRLYKRVSNRKFKNTDLKCGMFHNNHHFKIAQFLFTHIIKIIYNKKFSKCLIQHLNVIIIVVPCIALVFVYLRTHFSWACLKFCFVLCFSILYIKVCGCAMNMRRSVRLRTTRYFQNASTSEHTQLVYHFEY